MEYRKNSDYIRTESWKFLVSLFTCWSVVATCPTIAISSRFGEGILYILSRPLLSCLIVVVVEGGYQEILFSYLKCRNLGETNLRVRSSPFCEL